MMNIYENDPKYKSVIMSKNHQILEVLYGLELSKSARKKKHKITLFGNSYKSNSKRSKASL
ncbi:hypothetical protein C6497_13510 [Candidatus Poribacteria bacterium]|nr:MAG: hypothetical protein C6497_13510 [Candidatus Poribacteria bacterium]